MYCPLRIFADIPLSSAYWLMCSCFYSLVFCVSMLYRLLLSLRIYFISRLLLIFDVAFSSIFLIFFFPLVSPLLFAGNWANSVQTNSNKVVFVVKQSVSCWVLFDYSMFDGSFLFILSTFFPVYIYFALVKFKNVISIFLCEIVFRCSVFFLLFLISYVRVCLCCLSIVLSLEDFYQFLL